MLSIDRHFCFISPVQSIFLKSNKVAFRNYSDFKKETLKEKKIDKFKLNYVDQSNLTDFSSTFRNFLLMQFLRYPRLAKKFAQVAADFMDRGGYWQKTSELIITPLTKSFSVGNDVDEAVKKASLLLKNNQHLLLDLVDEMVYDEAQRAEVFQKFSRLLNQIKNTDIQYLPLKLSGIISPDSLIKLSRYPILISNSEKNLFDTEVKRLESFVASAVEFNKILFIDQEYPHQKSAIFKLGFNLMSQFNINYPAIYMTIQSADIACFDLVRRIHSLKLTKKPAVKLVNGAYVNWAHNNKFGYTVQPSKSHSFIAFILIAKFCLRHGINLFLGTHNPVLENIVDNFAKELNVNSEKYIKGQLYGFKTQLYPKSMYALFGHPRECIHYSLRRIIEGADSIGVSSIPFISPHEIKEIVDGSDLMEKLSDEEINQIAKAVRTDVQQIRVNIAREEVYKAIPSVISGTSI